MERTETSQPIQPENVILTGSPTAVIKGPLGNTQEGSNPSLGQHQLSDSLNYLAFVKSTMFTAANSVRSAAHNRESNHIENENMRTKMLEAEIEAEDAICKEMVEQMSEKWKGLLSCKAPQELSQSIADQCKECDSLLESKRKIVEMIRAELKLADEDYQRMFRQQGKDIDALLVTMGSQVLNMHNAHVQELSTIEIDFLAQRKETMLRNKAEIDALMKKVRSCENTVKEDLNKRTEDYAKLLDTIRTQDNEDYNLLKIKLETDIQTLEQHLASMEAAYQLNSEKLDYNYAVLVERDHDNYVTAGQQKRKLTKQRDNLCTLKARHTDYERRFLFHNGKLANDYGKVIRLLQDLQNKEPDMEEAQEKQHWEFLLMHHQSLIVLTSKLLQADKTIHEQQLGWLWHPPPKDIFEISEKFYHGDLIGEKTEKVEETTSMGGLKIEVKRTRTSSPSKDIKLKIPLVTDIEKLWRSYNDLVSPKVLHVWAAFSAALVSYNHLLQHRGKLMHEVHCLAQEQKALQLALEHCMSSKVVQQKIV